MSPLEFQLMYSSHICGNLVCVCKWRLFLNSLGLGFNMIHMMLFWPDLGLRLSSSSYYRPHYKKQRGWGKGRREGGEKGGRRGAWYDWYVISWHNYVTVMKSWTLHGIVLGYCPEYSEVWHVFEILEQPQHWRKLVTWCVDINFCCEYQKKKCYKATKCSVSAALNPIKQTWTPF